MKEKRKHTLRKQHYFDQICNIKNACLKVCPHLRHEKQVSKKCAFSIFGPCGMKKNMNFQLC